MAGKAWLRVSRQIISSVTSSVQGQTIFGKTDNIIIASKRLKYPQGTFSVNRYKHCNAWCNRNLSTAVELKKPEANDLSKNVCKELVTESLQSKDLGRLFAVVQIAGKQRKVTMEDILVVERDFFPSIGDKIRLEKVLLVGGKDFTLIGRPLLSRDQVYVEATVVEKTLSNFKVKFWYKRRKDVSRYKSNDSQDEGFEDPLAFIEERRQELYDERKAGAVL